MDVGAGARSLLNLFGMALLSRLRAASKHKPGKHFRVKGSAGKKGRKRLQRATGPGSYAAGSPNQLLRAERVQRMFYDPSP